MGTLPEYRRIHMRLMICAGAEAADEVRAHLIDTLQWYGAVEVRGGEPYWKDPANLEFGIELIPAGRAAECAAALWATSDGWQDCPGGFDEPELAPTGRRIAPPPEQPAQPVQVISVRPDGTITGSSCGW